MANRKPTKKDWERLKRAFEDAAKIPMTREERLDMVVGSPEEQEQRERLNMRVTR